MFNKCIWRELSHGYLAREEQQRTYLLFIAVAAIPQKFLVCVQVCNRSNLSHPRAKTSFNLPKGNLSVKATCWRSRPKWSQAGVSVCPLPQRNLPWERSDFSQVESQPWFTEQKTSLARSQLRICPWHTREIFRLIGCQPEQYSISLKCTESH